MYMEWRIRLRTCTLGPGKPYTLQFNTLRERECIFGVELPFEALQSLIMVAKIEMLPIIQAIVCIIGVCTVQ